MTTLLLQNRQWHIPGSTSDCLMEQLSQLTRFLEYWEAKITHCGYALLCQGLRVELVSVQIVSVVVQEHKYRFIRASKGKWCVSLIRWKRTATLMVLLNHLTRKWCAIGYRNDERHHFFPCVVWCYKKRTFLVRLKIESVTLAELFPCVFFMFTFTLTAFLLLMSFIYVTVAFTTLGKATVSFWILYNPVKKKRKENMNSFISSLSPSHQPRFFLPFFLFFLCTWHAIETSTTILSGFRTSKGER